MYKLIYDPDQVKIYFSTFLREVCGNENTESVKVLLQSRRKYNETQSKPTIVLARRAISMTATNEDFLDTLKKFEIQQGLYKDKGNRIPDSAICIYITSNTLSRVQATKNITRKVVSEYLLTNYMSSKNSAFPSLDKMFLTELHKCPASKVSTLDVDTQDPECIDALNTFLKKHDTDLIFIIKSPNGYHYTFVRGTVMRYIHHFINQNKDWVSLDNNGMNGIPGCLQGGKEVKLIYAKGNSEYTNIT